MIKKIINSPKLHESIIKSLIFLISQETYENHKNLGTPYADLENHESRRILRDNHENHEITIILPENNENSENHRIS